MSLTVRQPYWQDPYFLPAFIDDAGSPGYWHYLPSDEWAMPGLTYLWRPQNINDDKLSALDDALHNNASFVKERWGIEGYKLRFVITDYFTDSRLYKYWENGAMNDVKMRYRWLVVYDGKLAVARLVVFR